MEFLINLSPMCTVIKTLVPFVYVVISMPGVVIFKTQTMLTYLNDFLKCADMCMLNGRSEHGNGYTSVSPKDLAVVDYCLTPIDALTQSTNFKILDILDVAEEFSIDLLSKMPDHSLLTWDLTVKTMIDDDMLHTHAPSSKHYRKIPDKFLESTPQGVTFKPVK